MSEEKTRIVPRSPPKQAGDRITFNCDNGHRIVVSAKLAGKRGTCSKCGIAVVIPAAAAAAEFAAPPAEAAPELSVSVADEAIPAVPLPETDAVAEAGASTEANEFAGLFGAVAADHTQESPEVGVPAEPDFESGASGVGDVLANGLEAGSEDPYDTAGIADNPTAQLVARLWTEREHGGKIEIHLTGGGGVLLPEWYEANWSRGTHALFANQAADGSVTLTAVAWDSVQKVIVRQVQGLPDGMFE
jgi:hypothetical protein